MKRHSTAQEKKLADDARLLRAWKKFHAEEKAVVLAGPHGSTLAELFRMLANLQHVQPSQLIGYARSIDWAMIDHDTKLTALHEVAAAITKFREKRGLPPIDDSLGNAPPNAFQIIRKILTEFPASLQEGPPRRGPYPGANHE